MKPKIKYFFAQVKAVDAESRTIVVVASTIEQDRDGDVIQPAAFKKSLKSFIANPVILACHQHRLQTGSSPVIGSAITDTIEITKTEFTFTLHFASTDLGEEYWVLYRDKHMRAFSVGFIPQKYEDTKDNNGRFLYRTYTQVELLEVSAVPVPSNRLALARAQKGGFYDPSDLDELTEPAKYAIPETLVESIEACIRQVIDDGFDEIKSIILADPDRFAKSFLGNDSESPDPAGDTQKTENIVSTINNINSNIGDK